MLCVRDGRCRGGHLVAFSPSLANVARSQANTALAGKGYGGIGERTGDDVSSRYGYGSGGIAFGYDLTAGNCLFGVSVGYGAARVSMDDLDETGNLSLYQAALYGSYRPGPWYVNGIAAYGYNRYDELPGTSLSAASTEPPTRTTAAMRRALRRTGFHIR
jgi:uncharacterized protein with beta-barrel porin domain